MIVIPENQKLLDSAHLIISDTIFIKKKNTE